MKIKPVCSNCVYWTLRRTEANWTTWGYCEHPEGETEMLFNNPRCRYFIPNTAVNTRHEYEVRLANARKGSK